MARQPKDDDTGHLIEDPAENKRFQNATLAQIRIKRAEKAQLQGAIKKINAEEAALWSDIKHRCGIDRDIAQQGLAIIDNPDEEKRLARLAMWQRFFANAGVGEQASMMPVLAPVKAPDQALDDSTVRVAQADGFTAGLNGGSASENPYAGASSEGVAWASAYSRGKMQRQPQPQPPAESHHDDWAAQQLDG